MVPAKNVGEGVEGGGRGRGEGGRGGGVGVIHMNQVTPEHLLPPPMLTEWALGQVRGRPCVCQPQGQYPCLGEWGVGGKGSVVDPDPDPGSGSVLDPYSTGTVDPDPDP